MVTVLVLVCFVVIASLCGVLLRIGLAERDRIRAEQRRLQADWLVESGLERAAAKLEARHDYKGEVWELSSSDLGGTDRGRVTITVDTPRGKPGGRKLRVTADYPRDATLRSRVSKEVMVDIASDDQGAR